MVHIHKSILYIEDDPDLQETYERALSAAGYKVHTAQHAQEAIDVLDIHHRVDIVIADLFLPEHNGLSVLHQLQSYADWQTIPALILSSYEPKRFKAEKQYMNDLNVVQYLSKQATPPAKLVKIVEAIIGGNSN